MTDFRRLFMDAMDREGIVFTLLEDGTIRMDWAGANKPIISLLVAFDREEAAVHFHSENLLRYPIRTEGDLPRYLGTINRENRVTRWVTFYLRGEEVLARMDAPVHPEHCGERCIALTRRMAAEVDRAYASLAARPGWS